MHPPITRTLARSVRPILAAILLVALVTACGDPAIPATQAVIAPTATATIPPPATATATAAAAATATATRPAPTTTPPPTPTSVATPTATATSAPTATVRPSPTATRPAPTATRPAASPVSGMLSPTAPIPPGWQAYGSTTLPFAIAYPPGWFSGSEVDSARLRSPDGTSVFTIFLLSRQAGARTAEQERDAFWAMAAQPACGNPVVEDTGDDIWGGIVFSALVATCDTANGPRVLYLAAGIGNGLVWGLTVSDTVEKFDASADAFFDPMLSTLNFGLPAAASPGPSGPQPRPPIPARWRTYAGSGVPFAIAYPPDWRADTANERLGYVNFVAPDGLTTVQIRQAGDLTATLGIERLRELYMEELGKKCGTVAQAVGYDTFSEIRFAALRIDCTSNSGVAIDLYYGTGIKDGEEWTISLTAPAGAWDAAARQYFGPILDTLSIADKP